MLLAVLATNLLWLSYSRGITQDEVIHIPAGQYQLQQRDFRMNNVTPPAVKTLSSLPTILAGSRVLPRFPQDPNVDYETRDYQIAKEFWTANNDRFRSIVFTARVGAVILTVLLGFMVFIFARQLFGLRPALLALVLFILEPNIIAHGHIVHADVIAALALLFFGYVLVNYWRNQGLRWTLLLGAAAGFALISKFTLVALVAAFIIALAARWNRSRISLKQELLAKSGAILLCLLIVNAAYFFEARNAGNAEAEIANIPGFAGLVINLLPRTIIRATSVLAPTDFVQGFSRLSRINQQGHDAYLLGKYSVTGWWYYFPVAFSLKTTLPFLLVTLAAAVWAIARLFSVRRRPFIPMFAAIVFYAALLATSRINVGVRHLLPLFPFLFIMCGAFLDWLIAQHRRIGPICVTVVIAAMSFEAVRAWPTYMSYMNQMTTGHQRWSYLGDSNIEWGQDTAALAAYLNARGVKKIRGAMLCGEVALPRYGIEYVNLLSGEGFNAPPTEFIAIGANFLNGSLIPGNREWFQSYRDRKPEAVFGDSIYLYRFEGEPSTAK